jgi:mono/diheme cytochrome c family protein
MNLPPSEFELIGHGDGTFSGEGAYLSLPGKWQVEAVVRRENRFDAFADFDFTLQKLGSNSKTTASLQQTGSLIALIGLLSGLITLTARTNRIFRFGLGVPLSLLVISFGLYFLMRPPAIENTQANPIPPTSESIAAGGAVFETNCVPCHGVSGRGDGPVGLTMNPRPADLTQHAIPGIHTDGQLYEWITNGFPGTRMPAFKTVLSDTDRWNLVNYIRTFAPK